MLVVGLLDGQQGALYERCRGLPVKLEFVSKERRRPFFPPNISHVFLFVKWTSHVWQIAAYARLGHANVTRHMGAVSSAVNAIRRLL